MGDPVSNRNDDRERGPLAVLTSDALELGELGELMIFGAGRPLVGELEAGATLKDNGIAVKLGKADRAAMIERARAGAHLEIEFSAITFRQKDGAPNRNGLRFKASKLGKIARSFTGKPALVDHRSWSQAARIGTITASEAVDLGDGWTGFRQTIRVVKPDAVISVLDGTIDRFSIGWAATGPVTCSIHGTPARAACDCWPGDEVAGLDGTSQIAEYEFSAAEGDETSGVNTPAVSGTKIEEIRAALSTAIRTTHDRQEKEHMPPIPTDDELARARLALESERDTYRARAELAADELAAARAELATAQRAQLATSVDRAIDGAYQSGRLLAKRDAAGARIPSSLEPSLRKLGAAMGADALAAQISDLPIIAPLGARVELGAEAPRTELGASDPAIVNASRQLGIPAARLADNRTRLGGERRNKVDTTPNATEG